MVNLKKVISSFEQAEMVRKGNNYKRNAIKKIPSALKSSAQKQRLLRKKALSLIGRKETNE